MSAATQIFEHIPGTQHIVHCGILEWLRQAWVTPTTETTASIPADERQTNNMRVRLATAADATAIATIYNQGIEDRVGTFETTLRTATMVQSWFDGIHPTVVVEQDGEILAYASTSTYRPRACYAGVAEFSIYVRRDWRGKGVGRLALSQLIRECAADGFWKLVSRVFVENVASRALLQKLGFREVGIYEKHGQLDGVWRDVVIVEYLLPEKTLTGSGQASAVATREAGPPDTQ